MAASNLLTRGLGLGAPAWLLLTDGLGASARRPAPLRDWVVLERIAALIRAADDAKPGGGGFHEVATSGLPEDHGTSAEYYRKLSLELVGWSERDLSGEPGRSALIERTVEFRVVVMVRDADPTRRDSEADRLQNLATNAVRQARQDGWLVPDKTMLARGRYALAQGVERRIDLSGRACYLIDAVAGRDAAPDPLI